ncbi:MAG: Hpt domain-containing protein [Bacteroidota bacterium]
MEFKIINVSYIEEICDNSPELITEMINIFREQVLEFSGELKKLYQEKKYYDLGLLAHKAKSSVLIMGMDEMADKLKELELKAIEGVKTESYGDYIKQFDYQTGEALKELDDYLKML